MNKLYIFIALLFTIFTYSQENCANGIDDDGDGKIDLNDPDCVCATSLVPSIIPNPSFETFSACPSSFSQLNFATPWIQATEATSDYFNSCGFIMPGILSNNLQNFPSGNGIAGAIFLKDYKEYLGATLTSPMIVGTDYQLTLNIAALTINNNGTSAATPVSSLEPVKVTLYGCMNGNNLPITTYFSPNLADPSWIEIGNVTYTPVSSWGEITITFTPTFNVGAIMIGSPAVLPATYLATSSGNYPYFLYDNLLLNTASSFGVNISQQGNFCDNNLVLSANLTTTLSGTVTYQWYKDGIAIIGATGNTCAIPSFASNIGSYSVRVTSGTSCFVSSRAIINNTIPSPTFTTIQPTCIVTTGTITITTPALQYSFDNGVTWQSSPTRSLLPVGTHYIKIKTPSGCISSSAGVDIVEPQLLAGSSVTVIHPTTCDGTGTITVTSSLAAQYSFDGGTTWTTNNIANNLQPGTYQIKIKDAVGCESGSQYIYISRIYLTSPAVTVVQPTCGVGGSLTVTTPASEYSFDDGVTWVSSNVASNLVAGSYGVIIKDAAGCQSDTQYVYLATYHLNIYPETTEVDPICGIGGSIAITTVATEYSFDDGVTWSTSNTASNLAPGMYSIVIKDSSGCISYTHSAYLHNVYLPHAEATTVDPICGTGGSITITTVANQYSFDNGVTWTTSNTASNLNPGTYYIMIKDSAGCTSSSYYVNLNFFNLPEPLYTTVNPSCGNNGSITITSIANEYSFDGGATWTTNPVKSNLSAGYYTIKVRNAVNCESNYLYVTLENFESLYPEFTYTNAGCETYASITVTSSADYYSFDNGANWSTNPFMGGLLGAQTYQIITRNGLSCVSQTQNVTITSEYSINPLATNYHATECDDLNDGIENVDLTNYQDNLISNPSNYSFTYYTSLAGATTANPAALVSNFTSHPLSNTNNKVYVRVVSIKNCSSVVELTFAFIDSPRIHMDDMYPLCEFRTALIEAGHGFDSYLWSTTQTHNSIVVGSPGNYFVTVTEDHGTLTCSSRKDFTVFLSNPATITSINTFDWTADENVIEVLVTGLGNYEYSLDGIVYQDSNRFENLVPGIYRVFVKDKYGCGIVNGEALLLNYPKFFTPNGDGINETWYIKFSQFENEFDVKIFNREGKLIKAMKSSEAWDGTYNGHLMPSDDYWFYVTRKDGEIHKGHFSMVR